MAVCIYRSVGERVEGYMTKAEFLDALRMKLAGEVSASEIEHTIRYYDEYISEAVNGGKTEQQVMEELGSPLLIAKTIIDTSTVQEENTGRRAYRSGQGAEKEPQVKIHHVDLESWTTKLLIGLAAFVVLAMLFTILRVLIPLLFPLFVVWMIVTIIRNGGRR